MPLQHGTTLGPYAVVAKIGEGGMGEVYRARDTKLDSHGCDSSTGLALLWKPKIQGKARVAV